MEVLGSKGAFTASVVWQFTEFQLAGNILVDCDKEKVSHFKRSVQVLRSKGL
jgi:hypothetical protein